MQSARAAPADGPQSIGQASAAFGNALLDVFVQSRNDSADVFSACGLVMRVELGPDRCASLDVAQLQFHGDTGYHRTPRNFLESRRAARAMKIPVDIASQSVDSAILAGCAKLPQQNFRDHFRGRFSPAVILVGSHALAARAINDLVFAVESGAGDAANQQSDGKRIDRRGRQVSGTVS